MVAVILTTFAGRKKNLIIQKRYVDVLFKRGYISEWHLWNFCRKSDDEQFVKSLEGGYIKVHHPTDKTTWVEYYRHYTKEIYPDHVIIKSDDDIVYIDVDAFPGFIQRRIENKDDFLAFASIVNNCVCAAIQQQDGLIPESVGSFPLTCGGPLWKSGALAEKLHEYFLNNKEEWLTKARSLAPQTHRWMRHRISINFFAILSQDLDIFNTVLQPDDEHVLSVTLPHDLNRQIYIDKAFTVSHLSFYTQRDDGIQEGRLQEMYLLCADPYEEFVDQLAIPDVGKHALEFVLEHIEQSSMSGLFCEFGVCEGRTISMIANTWKTKSIYGFDSFQGLPETWERTDGSFGQGFFSTNGLLPQVPENVQLIKGLFSESLPVFCKSHAPEKIAFMHIDCDLYSSTKCIFDVLYEHDMFSDRTLVVFDELVNYSTFKDHELKAFYEFLTRSKYTVEWIGMLGKIIKNNVRDFGPQYQSVACWVIKHP